MTANIFLNTASGEGNRPGYWLWWGQIGLINLLGIVSTWRLGDGQFIAPAALSVAAWLLLLKAMTADSRRWRSWLGILQFAASWLAFPLFKAIQLAMPRSADSQLLAIDRWLFGGQSATEHLLGWQQVWLSELMSLCYLSFYFIILVPVIFCAFRRYTPAAKGFLYGLMLMYLIGFTGYLLVPAAGPYIAFPEVFSYPAPGGAMTALLTGLVAQGGTGMDVFPSLHCGISLYVLGYLLIRRHTLLLLILSPLVAGLILATLYLRYHYGIDLIAGTLSAAGVILWLRRSGFARPKDKIRMTQCR
ncbi:phosphatase PAP2 family protein [Entomohabitans teleogrylli]|uniref:phosphatase PAP2 family protein n=1 Tax=Entomohabitans teleogrylli TaxID=1384589 RepID=UPI00073D42DC|nr:phosphatase PAP2 family protein [Entomohabitans teleogrylli]